MSREYRDSLDGYSYAEFANYCGQLEMQEEERIRQHESELVEFAARASESFSDDELESFTAQMVSPVSLPER